MYDASAARDLVHDKKRHIVEELGLGEAVLHELSLEDVLVSREAWETIGRIAGMIMQRYAPHPSAVPGCVAPMLREMSEEVYWVEQTRQLVFRVEYGGDVHLIQLPRAHWMIRARPAVTH